MKLSSQRDMREKYHIPEGVKFLPKDSLPTNSMASGSTSQQQKVGKSDTQILCKRLNEEPVKIKGEGERKDFVPLPITLEKRKKGLSEQEPNKRSTSDLHQIVQPASHSEKTHTVLPIKQQIHPKTLRSSDSEGRLDKPRESVQKKDNEKRLSLGLPPRSSAKPTANTAAEDALSARRHGSTKRNEGSRSREPSKADLLGQGPINNHIVPLKKSADSSKYKRSKSSERKTVRKSEEQPRKESKPTVSAEFEQMVRENAKRLLEEKKRKREEEQRQREYLAKKKHRIIEEDKQVRELNKQHIPAERPSHTKFAWGVDQRKFQQQNQYGRDYYDHNHERSPSEETKKYYKLDERERRERLGLGHLDDEKMNEIRRKSKSKVNGAQGEGKQKREELSTGRIQAIKKVITPEQEQKLKEFMELQRQRMGEEERLKAEEKQKEKHRIKENLDKLREGQKKFNQVQMVSEKRYSVEPLESERRLKKPKKKRKSGKKSLSPEGASRSKNKLKRSKEIAEEDSFDDISLTHREGEEERDFDFLQSEARKIIYEKHEHSRSGDISNSQYSSRHYPNGSSNFNSTSGKGVTDRYTGRGDNSNDKRANYEPYDGYPNKKEHKTSEGHGKDRNQRKEKVKKQFMELAKKMEDVFGSNEGERVEEYSSRDRRVNGVEHKHKQKAPQEKHKREQREEQRVSEELNTSNFSEEDYLNDKGYDIHRKNEHQRNQREDEYVAHNRREKPAGNGKLDSHHHHHQQHHPHHEDVYYDENYFENEEAYRQNYGIIEAAAIFIQKNYRGYLTRKLLREYFDEMEGEYGQNYREEYSSGRQEGDRDQHRGVALSEEQRLLQKYGQRLSKSFDDELNSDPRRSDEGSANRDFRKSKGKRVGTEEDLEEFAENDEQYEQINRRLMEELGRYDRLDHGSENENDLDQRFYKDLNEKLQGQMMKQNAGKYNAKNKFAEDNPRIGNDEGLDVSYEDETPHEDPKDMLKGGQKINLQNLISQQKQSVDSHDLNSEDREGAMGYPGPGFKRQYSDGDIKGIAWEEPRAKMQKKQENKPGDGGSQPKKHEQEKPKAQPEKSMHSQSESQQNSVIDKTGLHFPGNTNISPEKMVMISNIPSDIELPDGDEKKAPKAQQQGAGKNQGSVETKKAPEKKESIEPQEPKQNPETAKSTEQSAKKQGSARVNTAESGEVVMKEINDNSKSLITIGEYDEADRDTHTPDKVKGMVRGPKQNESGKKANVEEKKEQPKDTEQIKDKATIEDTPLESTPRTENRDLLQKTLEITKIYHNELSRVREEQSRKLTEIINQLSFLQSADPELSSKAKNFIENLQQQIEDNKKMLQENFELQKAARTNNSTVSEDKSLLHELEYIIKQNIPSNLTSMQNTMFTPQDFGKEMGLSAMKSRDLIQQLGSPPLAFTSDKKKNLFNKRSNLEIDTDSINREQNEERKKANQFTSLSDGGEALNLELSEMRLAFGSEALIKQQSAKALSYALNTPTGMNLRAHDYFDEPGNELHTQGSAVDEQGASIFDRDPFKEFTNKKFHELLKHENITKMIKMREQALEIRHKSQVDHMQKMLENKRVSPRTFQHKQLELEKWVTKEREQIKKSKTEIEKGWISFAEAIKKTERDMQFLKKGDINSLLDDHLRLPFKSEEENGESDGEHSHYKGKQNKGSDNGFTTPGSSKNVINIVDKFELKEGDNAHKFVFEDPSRRKPQSEDRETQKNQQEVKNKGSSLSPHHIDDLEEMSLEGSLKDSAALKKKLKELNIQPEEIEKDAEYEEHMKHLSALQEELGAKKTQEQERKKPKFTIGVHNENLTGEDSQPEESLEVPGDWEKKAIVSPHGVVNTPSNDKVDPMRSSKGFAIGKGESPGGASVEEMSDDKYKKIHEELREITDDANKRLLNPANSPKKSPVGTNPGIIDAFAFESLESFEEPSSLNRSEDSKKKKLGDGAKVDELPLQKPQNINEGKINQVTEAVMQHLFSELQGDKVFSGSTSESSEKTSGVKLSMDQTGTQTVIPTALDANDIFGSHNKPFDATENEIPPVGKLGGPKQSQHLEKIIQASKDIQYTEEDIIPGFPTGMDAVNDYLNLLCYTIKSTYKREFLQNINIPLGLTPEEKLTNLHVYDPNQSEASLDLNRRPQRPILSIDLYIQIEDRIKEKFLEKDEILLELELFHNKGVFDAFNEALDSCRPYGMLGIPYSWKSYKVHRPQEIKEEHMDLILERTKEKVLIWSSFMCGYLAMGEFLSQRPGDYSEEYLAQIREERLARLLAQEVFETEERWLNYDDEETEVNIEISDLIFDRLAQEAAETLMYINERRNRERQIMDLKSTFLPKKFKYEEPQESAEDKSFASL